jgi:hypothetical protein
MKRLIWIGSPFFGSALRACGWEVCAVNFEEPLVFSWADLTARAGWEPDVLVVADKSRPPFVLGMEDMPCLTVLYCVDSHIHSWQPLYAQGFDLCLVSLRDHLPLFGNRRLDEERIRWFPPFAKDEDRPDPAAEAQWDCLFVGTLNPGKTPKRMAFLRELGALTPGLHACGGSYRRLFPKGAVVLNHCEAGDLNFRVFEALGCGACLVTPRVGHGLLDLFREGVHFLCYAPDKAEDAAQRIRELLADPSKRARLRAAGLEAVDAGHRAAHRARALNAVLRGIPRGRATERRRIAPLIRENWLKILYLHLAAVEAAPQMREAFFRAATGTFGADGF